MTPLSIALITFNIVVIAFAWFGTRPVKKKSQ